MYSGGHVCPTLILCNKIRMGLGRQVAASARIFINLQLWVSLDLTGFQEA